MNSMHHSSNLAESKPPVVNRTLTQTIFKYKLHYLIVLPALFLVLIIKLIPFAQGIYISFIDMGLFQGLTKSAWIGIDIYTRLFKEPDFWNAVSDTLIYKICYVAAMSVIAFVVALALSGLKSHVWRGLVITILLLPYVIPSVVFSSIFLSLGMGESPLLSSEGSTIFNNPQTFPFVYIALEIMKNCGIPILIALAAIGSKRGQLQTADETNLLTNDDHSFWRNSVIPAARALIAVALLQLAMILSTDSELYKSLVSPLTRENLAFVDEFIFRTGLANMQYSFASAAWIITFIIQLALVLTAYYVVRGKFLKDLFTSVSEKMPKDLGGSKIAGISVAILSAATVSYILYLLFIRPFLSESSMGVSLGELVSATNMMGYLLIYGVATVIFMFMTLTLAYPMTVKRLPGGTFYRILLIAVILMGGVSVHEFHFFFSINVVGTIFAPFLVSIVNIVAVFVLKGIFNSKYSHLKEQAEKDGRGELHTFFTLFIPKVWKPLLALGVLHFIAIWNAYTPSIMYITDMELATPMMQFYSLIRSNDFSDPVILQYGAIISLPSVLFFLCFRKWITSEVLIQGLFKR